MDLVTITIGVVISLYGIYTLMMRIKSPEKFGKLSAMKDKFGDTAGNTIHIIAYTVLPIVSGVLVVFAGFKGQSIIEIIRS
jgi:hypothetical protein